MNVLIAILVPLGLLILTIFHSSRIDDDGVPQAGYENGVHVAEILMAALVGFVLMKVFDAPGWGALGIVGLGLYIRDVQVSVQKSIRKRAVVS